MALSRGAYRWRMAVPKDGIPPNDGLHPALIEWQSANPAPQLPESGCRLERLEVCHPAANALAARLGITDPRLRFETGAPRLSVTIATRDGPRVLT